MTSPVPIRSNLSLRGDQGDMGRRRGQRKGWLREHNGQWRLTYRLYDVLGRPKREDVPIGPAEGPGKLTRKQAERQAFTDYLSKADELSRKPKATITVTEFWDAKYWPQVELRLRLSTRGQYKSLWEHWLKSRIGGTPVALVTVEHVEQTLAEITAAKKSPATVKHCRKVISAIFSRAKRLGYFTGDNPAGLVEMQPVTSVRKAYALSVQQAKAVLAGTPAVKKTADQKAKLATPERFLQMIKAALLTGMNAAELCGLRWAQVNTSEEPRGDVPARCIAVREHWYRGEAGALKTGNRYRNLPICDALGRLIEKIREREQYLTDADYVFCGRTGEPLTEQNIRRRHLTPLCESLGLPYLGWHVFRHTCATWCADLGMQEIDRQVLLGHAPATMSMRYTHADLDRMRDVLDRLAERLEPVKAGGNVVEMRRVSA